MHLSIQEMRTQALNLLLSKSVADAFLPIDYEIDADARDALDLPPRPEGQKPYVGWIVGRKNPESKRRVVSQAGLALIKKYEGCRTNAYKCPAGVWTIGYGHTKGVSQGMMISHRDADRLLEEDLKYFESAVSSAVTVPINQNQFDALVSLAFNIGVGAFDKSTLLARLNRKGYVLAANQFLRWTRGGGKVLPGLVKRRQEERELFLS